MTKAQKKMFKSLKKAEHKSAFIQFLMLQQKDMGKYAHWRGAYAKKCAKKGIRPPKAA